MSRNSLPFLIVAMVVLPGCPQVPGTPGTPQTGASAVPSAGPSGPAPVVSATPTPVREQVQISGKIFDDEGDPIEAATVHIESSEEPALNQSVQALGGAYVVPGIPVGVAVRVIVEAEGFAARSRTHRAAPIPVDTGRDVNRLDFGGTDVAEVFALSEYPEIAAVTPANRATGVTVDPLEVAFAFSHPILGEEQRKFARLLRLRFLAGGGADSEAELIVGSEYEGQRATLNWNEAGTQATFRFDAPLVTRLGDNALVRVEFESPRDIEAWPKATNGKRLGRGIAPRTATALGGAVSDRIAPILRSAPDPDLPDDAEPLEIWGRAHQTSSVFSLAAVGEPPRVTGVQGYTGNSGDRIEITFDRPMRGFPEAAIDPETLKPSNYRYVLGRTDDSDARARYAALNPATQGGSAGEAPSFSTQSENVLNLRLPAGTLGDFDVFKLYVDPAVKDISGTGIKTSAQDPTTFLADHVLEGTIR